MKDIEIYSYKTSFLKLLSWFYSENAIFQLKTFKEKDRKIIVVAENLADGKIRVLVEDNGGGIAIEHLDSHI